MSETFGLVIFGLIVGFFALLFWLTYARVETGAKFASERGWEFQDLLPQFGRAQRQHIFRSASPDGILWELVINLKQSDTQTVPIASTVWSVAQIHSRRGLVLLGPALGASFDQFDFTHPVITLFLRVILGDEADQISHLQRVPLEGQSKLTVLATNPDEARRMITLELLEHYQTWLKTYTGEDLFPVLYVNQQRVQIKVKNPLTKATDADAFVAFCLNVAHCLKQGSS